MPNAVMAIETGAPSKKPLLARDTGKPAIISLNLFFAIRTYHFICTLFKKWVVSFKSKFDFIAVTLALQWVVILFTWGLIPFGIWV